MSELRSSIELNTPAVLGGAETRRCDPYFKLRPSSVRGGLRYWFRAAAASLLWPEHGNDGDSQRRSDNKMLEALRELEARVFGDTSRRSKVILAPPEGGVIGRWSPTPDPRRSPGLRYLGYGLFEDRRPPERLTADGRDVINLRVWLADDSPKLRDAVAASLWLWTTFGGLGARARRGFGSMQLKTLEGANASHQELCAPSASNQAHLELVQRGIGLAQDAITELVRHEGVGAEFLSNSGQRPHPHIRTLDGIARLQALECEFDDPLQALEYAGSLFQRYRSSILRKTPLPDYHAVKQSLQPPFKAPKTVDRAAFGLPLNFYYRSLGGTKAQFLPRAPEKLSTDEQPDRVASPLLLRVHALQPKPGTIRYGVMLINLAGRNTTPLLDCSLRERRDRGPINPPSGSLLDAFIDWAVQESRRTKPSHARRRQ